MVNFSFIIPLYNKDNSLLQRCLKSVPLDLNIQVIIVDDHSPSYYDKAGQLKYDITSSLPYYDNINVEYYFITENGGPGKARNFALTKAKGEWVFFCDADDYFEKCALLDLMKVSSETEADVIFFGYNKIKGSCSEVCGYGAYDESVGIQYIDNKDNFWMEMFPWQRMVRRSFIQKNKLGFENLYLSEDRLFCIKQIALSDKLFVYNRPIYNYVQYEESLSHVKPSQSKAIGAINVAMKVNLLLKENGKLETLSDCTLPKYLSVLYDYSPVLYWIYTIKNIFRLGWKSAMKDRQSVCYMRNVHSNLYLQWKTYIKNGR